MKEKNKTKSANISKKNIDYIIIVIAYNKIKNFLEIHLITLNNEYNKITKNCLEVHLINHLILFLLKDIMKRIKIVSISKKNIIHIIIVIKRAKNYLKIKKYIKLKIERKF